jgi:primosomal protein N' (replication factor Y)
VVARARRLADLARGPAAALEVAVLGPAEAPLARLKGRTRWHLWLRAPERRPLRRLLAAIEPELESRSDKVRVTIDVDPVSAL